MKVTIGVVLELAGKIGDILKQDGILDANGDAVTPVSVQAIAKVAADVEQLLVSHGVVVPGQADKIIQVLPLLLSLAGVK